MSHHLIIGGILSAGQELVVLVQHVDASLFLPKQVATNDATSGISIAARV